jgi:UDPglucose 6-dehydrogenase
MKISFIGLGKLGLPCSEVLVEHGYDVTGYDVNGFKSKLVKQVDSIEKIVLNSDLIFISVPTPHDKKYDGSNPSSSLVPKDFDYSIVKKCLHECNKFLNENQAIVLISTVLPGTIREQLSEIVTNGELIYNPYYIAMGTVKWDMTNPDIVTIGSSNGKYTENVKKLISIYKKIIENNSPIIVTTWEECECIKVFYNTFITTKITFVNMIQDVAEKQGNINVDNVTKALCNAEKRILSSSYMKAGIGDGGACHPRDNIALKFLSTKLNLGYDYFGNLMLFRENQAKNIALTLIKLALKNSIMDIIIHGKTYKEGVSYTDGSYSLLVGHYCDQFGFEPIYFDKNEKPVKVNDPSIFLMCHNTDELYCDIPDGSIVVDMWRRFKPKDNITVIHYGNSRNRF